MPPLASQNREFYAPEVEILVDDTLIDRNRLHVSNLEVDLVNRNASLFSMRIANAMGSTLEINENWPFQMGARIKIRAGYQSALEDLLEGIITAVTFRYGAGEHLVVDVEGYDPLFLLMKSYRQRSFAQMSDSDVVRQVIGDYGLPSDIDESQILYACIRQDHESDFTLLSRLARRNGFEFFTRNGTICFKEPAFQSAPTHTFTYGVEPLAFECRHDLFEQFASVETYGWDALNNEAVSAQAQLGNVPGVARDKSDIGAAFSRMDLDDPLYPHTENYKNAESAQRGADALMQQAAYTLVRAKASGPGVATLRPSGVVEIAGFSEPLNGRYYVTRVVHRIGDGEGFATEFEMKGDRIDASL